MGQSGYSVCQGEGNGVLPRQCGNMDEANLGVCTCEMMEQGIEGIVADEGTGAIGNGAGKTCIVNSLCHGSYGDSGKIGSGAVGCDKLSQGLIACVVGDPGIPDIDSNALRCNRCTACSNANAQDYMGLKFCGGGQNFLGSDTENRR